MGLYTKGTDTKKCECDCSACVGHVTLRETPEIECFGAQINSTAQSQYTYYIASIKIKSLYYLEDNWDYEGARAIRRETIAKALDFIKLHITDENSRWLSIFPGINGSVNLSWEAGDKYLIANIGENHNTDNCEFYFTDRGDVEDEWVSSGVADEKFSSYLKLFNVPNMTEVS